MAVVAHFVGQHIYLTLFLTGVFHFLYTKSLDNAVKDKTIFYVITSDGDCGECMVYIGMKWPLLLTEKYTIVISSFSLISSIFYAFYVANTHKYSR